MLRKLHVKGFKTIYDQEIEFGKVNIFIGGNGAGKSNFLEAIGILSACLRSLEDVHLQKKGVRDSVPAMFKSSFHNRELPQFFSFDAVFDEDIKYNVVVNAGPRYEYLQIRNEAVDFKSDRVMGRSPAGVRILGQGKIQKNRPTEGLWTKYRDFIGEDISTGLGVEFDALESYAIFSPQTAFLRGTEIEAVPVRPLGLSGGGLAHALLSVKEFISKNPDSEKAEIISEILDIAKRTGWTSDYKVGKYDPSIIPRNVLSGENMLYFTDKYMKRTRNKLSAYDSSEGTLYLLFIATLLIHPQAPKVFAIDNVDNALNPRMAKEILSLMIDVVCGEECPEIDVGPRQVFLTSHNPVSLDAFDLFDDSQRVFIVKRDPGDGYTVIERLKPKNSWTREKWIQEMKGRSLSELWIEGKLSPGALGL